MTILGALLHHLQPGAGQKRVDQPLPVVFRYAPVQISPQLVRLRASLQDAGFAPSTLHPGSL